MVSEQQLHLLPPFDALMQRYEREIMRYLLRSTRDREEAADLFQETWLRAFRALSPRPMFERGCTRPPLISAAIGCVTMRAGLA
jgi:DNA-directed RNA polymerase specialized sigma24 family protein